jgi:hypothetical protein
MQLLLALLKVHHRLHLLFALQLVVQPITTLFNQELAVLILMVTVVVLVDGRAITLAQVMVAALARLVTLVVVEMALVVKLALRERAAAEAVVH